MRGAAWTLLVVGAAFGQSEPTPDWIDRLADPDPEVRFLAAHHVTTPEAVPALTVLLGDQEPAVREAALWSLGTIGAPAASAAPKIAELVLASPERARSGLWALRRMGSGALSAWMRLATSGHASLRLEAVLALGDLRPVNMEAARFLAGRLGQWDGAAGGLVHMGEPALPLLEHALLAGDLRASSEAASALAESGDLGQPVLLKGLASDRVEVRRSCVLELRSRSADRVLARPYLEAMARLCRDADPETRQRADELLCLHVATAPDLVVAALSDGDARIRQETTSMLRVAKAVPDPVLAALRTLLDDPEPDVRWNALLVLESRASPDAALLPGLVRALQDPHAGTRARAAEMLGALGEAAAPAAEVLGELLADQEAHVRSAALEALQKLGPAALPALPALCAYLRSGRASARAAQAIVAIGAPAVDPLAGMLADSDAALRARAAWCLGEIGSDASVAVPPLLEMLASREADLRAAAASALGGIHAEAAAVVPLLVKALSDRTPEVQRAAGAGLVRFGAEAAGSVASILDDADADSGLREDALRILVGIGPGAKDALATRTALLADPDAKRAGVARAAFVAVGEGGVPILERALADPNPLVRRQALWGLRELAPRVDGAFRALPGMLQDHDPSVRLWATRAIGELAGKEAAAAPALAAVVKDASVEVRRELSAQVRAASRRMAEWGRDLEPFLAGDDAAGREQAAEADARRRTVVAQLLPLLSAGLADPDEGVQSSALGAAIELHREARTLMADVARLLASPHPEVRAAAAWAMRGIVYLLPRRVGEYLAKVRSGAAEPETAAAVGLPTEVDPQVVSALVEALGDEDGATRSTSAHALANLASDEPALEALQERMWKDPEEDVQCAAAEAVLLGAVRLRRPEAVVDVLRKMALEPPKRFWDPPSPAGALSALGEEAGPALVAALRDPDPRVRGRCVSALVPGLGYEEYPKGVPAAVVGLLSDSDAVVRERARELVLQSSFDPGLDVLLAWVADPALEGRRWRTMDLLVRYHARAPEAIDALDRALEDKDGTLRRYAIESIGRLGAAGERYVPALVQALRDADRDVRRSAAYALGALGPVARPAAARLALCAAGWASNDAVSAIGALAAIGPDGAPWAPTLAARLDVDTDPERVMWIAEALGRMGPAAATVAPRLRALLADGHAVVRLSASSALIRMGCPGREVLETLTALLVSEAWYERRNACEALAEWGTGARAALPVLRKALEDPDPQVREAAAKAILAIDEEE